MIVDDLNAYLSSLQRLSDLKPFRIYPGHGPMLEGPTALNRPGEYIQHRQQRLKRALELLESSGSQALEQLLRGVYGSSLPSDAFLQHAARRNLEASLEKLETDGLARRLVGKWTSTRKLPASGYGTTSISLRGLLQRARPRWTEKDVAAAEAKLRANISDSKMLLDQLQRDELNQHLRSAGFRVFTADTLEALRQAGLGSLEAKPENERS